MKVKSILGGDSNVQLTMYNAQLNREERKKKKGYRVTLCSVVSSDFPVLLFSFFILLSSFVACDLFQPADPDYLKKIDEEVAWALAAKLTVTVAFPNEWGTSVNAGTNRCYDNKRTTLNPRQDYPFTVEFNSNAEYGLANWMAFRTDDLPEGSDWYINSVSVSNTLNELEGKKLTPDEIVFEKPVSSQTIVTIKIADPVTIIPFVKKQPRIISSDPPIDPAKQKEQYPPDTNITIVFASGVDPDTLIFAIDHIEIKGSDGKDLTNHYYEPVYNENTNTVTIASKGTLIADITKIVYVLLGTDIKPVDGYGMDEAVNFSFAIDKIDLITDWLWDCTKGSLNFKWNMPAGYEIIKPNDIIIKYRYAGADVQELEAADNNAEYKYFVTIPDAILYDGAGYTEGKPLKIPSYTITLTYGANYTTIETWAIPELSINSKNKSYILLEQSNMSELTKASNLDAVFILTENIELNNHTPVGKESNPFKGKFFGMGNMITINSFAGDVSGSKDIGLFGVIKGDEEDCIVRDLIVNYAISSTLNVTYFGCLASTAEKTQITNVIVKGNVATSNNTGVWTGNEDKIGGMVGQTNFCNITNVYSEITLTYSGTSARNIGGIIGYNSNSNVESCIYKGVIRSNDTISGGIRLGGIIGVNYVDTDGYFTINNCRAFGNIDIIISSSNMIYVGGVFGQLGGYNNSSIVITNSYYDEGNIYISNNYRTDAGGFVGDTSSNNRIVNCGTFGGTLTVINTNYAYVGGFIGQNRDTITDCFSKINIITNLSGSTSSSYVGGFVGRMNENGKIERCYASGSIRSVHNGSQSIYAGGLVGSNEKGHINDSYALGDVLVDKQSGTLYIYAGGLAGYTSNDSGSTNSIKNSFSTGQVIAQSNSGTVYAGGVIGRRYFSSGDVNGEFTNLAALGKKVIAAGGGTKNAGRIYGATETSTQFTNNYAIETMLISNTAGYDNTLDLLGDPEGFIAAFASAGSVVGGTPAATSNNGAHVGDETRKTVGFWRNTLMFIDYYFDNCWITGYAPSLGYPLLRGPAYDHNPGPPLPGQ